MSEDVRDLWSFLGLMAFLAVGLVLIGLIGGTI